MNDHQVLPMAAYFKEQGITLRFIEFMDVGSTNGWNFDQVVTKRELIEMIHKMDPLEPAEAHYFGEVAKRYRYVGTNVEVGFITSVSESFCVSCTRARISADGKFYTCLFATEGLDVRELLRGNLSDEELLSVIQDVWMNRKDRYSDERTEESAKIVRKSKCLIWEDKKGAIACRSDIQDKYYFLVLEKKDRENKREACAYYWCWCSRCGKCRSDC